MNSKKDSNKYFYLILVVVLGLFISLSLFLRFYDGSAMKPRGEIEISLNDTVLVKDTDLEIKLLKVNDSRCPARVTCVWKGQVSVTFNVIRGEAILGRFTLSTAEGDDSLFLNGYDIKLLDVSPYPQEAGSINQSDYHVRMIVSKR